LNAPLIPPKINNYWNQVTSIQKIYQMVNFIK
jgi:hypothetical protein